MCKTSAVTEYPTTKDRRLRIRSIPFPHVPLGRLRIGFHGLAGTTALFFTSLAILNVASGDGRPPPHVAVGLRASHQHLELRREHVAVPPGSQADGHRAQHDPAPQRGLRPNGFRGAISGRAASPDVDGGGDGHHGVVPRPVVLGVHAGSAHVRHYDPAAVEDRMEKR
eukprot:CAMPEP_0194307062 /NCGR_PEP_ID=MMETSP0171-20130528/3957_1 /TAXON_ID=218684 /ORGANISM="Corethron pennatum, Strain L29A3" /LENGTH=167 /DNA_ID=CAMNT_0039058947 /DNA_START=14 /DNA_END=517 /DNA_ORIENTATION=+